MDDVTLLGLVAGFLTTVAFVPQVLKIWRTRSAKDVSLPTFTAFALGVTGWIAFGVLKADLPIILWNAITLLLTLAIIAMKIRFSK
jgi:MtN3 and saliva related transmembrane protein